VGVLVVTLASAEPPKSGLSVNLGMSHCLGRPDLYEKIAQRYLQTWPGVPRSMREGLSKGKPDQVAFAAHALISTAGIVGAPALSDLARALHLSIEAGERHEWMRLVDEIDKEGALVGHALEAYLASREVQVTDSGR
jgi:HPt (histidine-containing phosphotransfer) domain-containing protein